MSEEHRRPKRIERADSWTKRDQRRWWHAARTLARKDGRTAVDHALSDGEDFELLFAIAARTDRAVFEKSWRARFATKLTCIGCFAHTGDTIADAIPLSRYHGYEHLAGA